MSKRDESKHKIDRRLGINLWGRAKSPANNNRDYGPGQHGQRRKKPTDFGTQLMAKQRLKGYYGSIGERQFRRLYEEAARRKGDTGENLVGLLERRLETLVYRAKFVPTVFAARQLINHGHVLLNGKRMNIGSYQMKENDVIEIRERSRDMTLILGAIQLGERDVPQYVDADHKKMTARLIRTPQLADIPYPVSMEPHLVVEYYSR
jgi:small subunit ribosomal protein S4